MLHIRSRRGAEGEERDAETQVAVVYQGDAGATSECGERPLLQLVNYKEVAGAMVS